jgi:hypothetical protein
MYSVYQSKAKTISYADEISQDIKSISSTYERAQKIFKVHVWDDDEPIHSADEHPYIKFLKCEYKKAVSLQRLHSPKPAENEAALRDAVRTGNIANVKKLLAIGVDPNSIHDSDLAQLFEKASNEHGVISGANRNRSMQGIGHEADDDRASMIQPPKPQFIFAYKTIVALLSSKEEPSDMTLCFALFSLSDFMTYLQSRKSSVFISDDYKALINHSFGDLLRSPIVSQTATAKLQKTSAALPSVDSIAQVLNIPSESIQSVVEIPIVGIKIQFKNTSIDMTALKKHLLAQGIKCRSYEGDGKYLSPSITIGSDFKEEFLSFIDKFSKINSIENSNVPAYQ